jgi:hypothetical protein
MEADELEFFKSFLRCAKSYVEFGCGGSTVLASSLIRGTIISLDSSANWLDSVGRACAKDPSHTQPLLVHADIGPTGDWGRPIDERCKGQWPLYSAKIWSIPNAGSADLYLIDGRFRVSCFIETLKRCRVDAVVLIHDFAPRGGYHIIRDFAREIAVSSNLSAFVRREDFDLIKAESVLVSKRYEPD